MMKRVFLCALLLAGLGAGGAGCGHEDTAPGSVVPTGDGSRPPVRGVSDADFRDPDLDAAADANSEDAMGSMDAGADGADAPLALKIEINIVKPGAGGVVPALLKFTPEVDVVVQSPS